MTESDEKILDILEKLTERIEALERRVRVIEENWDGWVEHLQRVKSQIRT